MLDAMPGLVGYWDLDLRYVFANQAYSDFFGLAPEQLTGLHISAVLEQSVYQANLPYVRAALAGRAQQFDRTLTRADGRIRHVQTTYTPDCADGAVRGIFVCALDITGRKEQELSLIAERGRLYDAEAVGNLGSWELDVSTRSMTFSIGFLTLCGLDPVTFSGDFREVLSCVLLADQAELHDAVEACINAGTPMYVRYRANRGSDGELRWLDCRAQAIFREARVVRIMGVVADITDRVLAEQDAANLHAIQLAAARLGQQYEVLLTTMFEGVVVQDTTGAITQANPAATNILGLHSDETGRTRMDTRWQTISEDGQALPREQYPAMVALATAEPVSNVTFGIVKPGGELSWIQVSSAPLFDPAGQVAGVISGFAEVTARRAADAEVAASRIRYQQLVENLPGSAVFVIDRDLRLVTCGGELLARMGQDPERMIGRPIADSVSAHDLTVLQPACANGLAGRASSLEYRSSSTGLYLMVDIAPLDFEHGVAQGVLVVAKDVTAHRHAELALADSQEQFRLAYETAPIGMAIVDLSPASSGKLLGVNPAMLALTGRSADALLSLHLEGLFGNEDGASARAMIRQLGSGNDQTAVTEAQLDHANGSTVWGQVTVSRVPASEVRSAHAICLIEDITLRKQAEQRLTYQSMHDPLTGLANRRLLEDRIQHALVESAHSNLPVGILYLDLDGFKQVNDSAGHSAGDALLSQVAQRLEHAVRPGDTVARLGGDEFAILAVDLADTDTLHRVATRCLDTLRLPFELSSGTHHISVSIGMQLSDQVSDPSQLLSDADTAMYEAKLNGKDQLSLRLMT